MGFVPEMKACDVCCVIHRESKTQKSPICDFLVRNPLLAVVSPSLIHTWAHVLKHLCSVPHIRPSLWIEDQKDPKVKKSSVDMLCYRETN